MREIPGSNAWKNHEPACATQPTTGGKVEICHCTSDLCNKKTDDIPNACNVPIPTEAPVVKVNCFQCSWSSDGNGLHDSRCGWKTSFQVQANINDPSVRGDCIKCGMLITFKGGY